MHTTWWAQILATAIGGLIAIAGLYVKTLLERRAAAQDAFEQRYLTGGIDTLIARLSTWRSVMSLTRTKKRLRLPSTELSVVDRLTGSSVTTELVGQIRDQVNALRRSEHPMSPDSAGRFEGTYKALNGLIGLMNELHRSVADSRVQSAKDVYAIAKIPTVQSVAKRIETLRDEYSSVYLGFEP